MPPASRKLLRAINRSQVLNAIRAEGPISRADIARVTGLSQASITGITSAMLADDLIREKQVGASTGGRPPILLDLNPESLYVVGIKLAEDHISAALTNIRADVLGNLTLKAAEGEHTVAWAVAFVEEAVNTIVEQNGIPWDKLAGVGIGMAGVIDSKTGACRYSPFFRWQNVPFRQLVEERLGVPVYVENDVNTLTMAEQWFGDGKDVDNFLVVTLGRGVGMGIVVNGEFYRGVGGGAGEFGHTVVDPDGPLCDCGKRGCLETYISDPALLAQARQALEAGRWQLNAGNPAALTLDTITTLAGQGVSPLADIFARAGRVLGISLANLVNIFDPEQIIITGEGSRAGDLLFGPMRDALAEHIFEGLAQDVTIIVQEWGDEAWARGAASLVLRELYRSPV